MMDVERIAITITPTPATVDLARKDLERLARITKLPLDKVIGRISKGKSITIVTPNHPRVADLQTMLRGMGFSVSAANPDQAAPVEEPHAALPQAGSMPPPEDVEWSVGDVIEHLYEVKDIKQGGMGAVYIVRHLRWDSMIAVKSLLRRFQETGEDRALFTKEAETWIDIGFHPNIAACYYVRNIRDNPRIFIEYVDGGALTEFLNRRTNVGWDFTIDLMVQACDGLGHAHTKGLVHRDV
ncbi:MAG: protein kinase, partial [Pseudomonadota bacterium]